MPKLDRAQASRLVGLSLGCVDRAFPNKPSHVYDGQETFRPPQDVTPAFYGCFDWHSAVHGHWAMVRVLRRFPELPEAARIRRALDEHLRVAPLGRELAFFQEKRSQTFERPYGWGWLLRLAAELHSWQDDDARRWEAALQPLASFFAGQLTDYLGRLSRPIRAGTHANTAFALVHGLDYARAVGDTDLAKAIEQRSREFYGADTECPTAYEPSGEDFISPCLVEADLMRRVLPPKRFVAWLDAFLPPFDSAKFRPLLETVEVRDRHDPRIGHLIGLFLQRAWCMEGIAAALPKGDPRAALLEKAARLHGHKAITIMFDSGYGGEHWLASFAVYLLTEQ
ncbi:MAG: DUF2891 domain-containing protein [Deltaproteobacteria bacterium]|nr:DUF2891 domain-containing protein [Deltaproteobacteria bacterium]